MTVVASADGRRVSQDATAGAVSTAKSITVWRAGSASLIRVAGDLDAPTIPQLQRALGAAAARHAWTILDLSLVSAVDRIALNTMIKGGCTARGRGGDLLLVASHDVVVTALEAARMTTAFRVFMTVPQALSAVPAHEFSPARALRKRGGAGHQ